MTSFALNYKNNIPDCDFNDLYLDSTGNIAMVDGVYDTEQTVTNSIWLWLGENIFDTTIGTDYAGKVFTANPDPYIVEFYLKAAITLINNYLPESAAQSMGIFDVQDYVSVINSETGKLSVSAVIILNSGEAITFNQVPLNQAVNIED